MRSVQPREHLEAALASEPRDHAAHAPAVLSCLHPAVPRLDARRERAERLGDLARGLVAQLVTDVAVRFDLVDPVVLRDHLRRDAVARRSRAGELAFRRDVDQGVPVAGRIDLRRGTCVRRHARRQRQVSPRRGPHGRRVDQAVSADPDAEIGLGRQVGQQVAALVVGHDDLAELRGRVRGLGNHPDAGLGTPRARHGASDVVRVDGDARPRAAQAAGRPTSPTTRRRPRRLQESTTPVSTCPCSCFVPGETRSTGQVCPAKVVEVDCAESPEESSESAREPRIIGGSAWRAREGVTTAEIRQVLARSSRSKAVARRRTAPVAATRTRRIGVPGGQPASGRRERRAHRRSVARRRRDRRQPDPRSLGHPPGAGRRCGARIVHRDNSAAWLPVHGGCRTRW